MTNNRSFFLGHKLVIILTLTAMSLMSHYIADSIHISVGTCWSCRTKEIEESRQGSEGTHTFELHELFLFNEHYANNLISRFFVFDRAISLGLNWIPPAPFRPPAIL